MLFFPKFEFRKICQNVAEFSPNFTNFFRDFSKMQHFSKKFERVGASPKFPRSFPEVSPKLTKLFRDFSKMQHSELPRASPKFPRSFPDVLQFGGQPTPPTTRPLLTHAAPPGRTPAGRPAPRRRRRRPWHPALGRPRQRSPSGAGPVAGTNAQPLSFKPKLLRTLLMKI